MIAPKLWPYIDALGKGCIDPICIQARLKFLCDAMQTPLNPVCCPLLFLVGEVGTCTLT